jgi:hypothetical protein
MDLDLVVPDHNPTPHLCKLWYLRLINLDCTHGASELLSYVDTSQLSMFELDLCQHAEGFLNTLSSCLMPESTHLTRCNIFLPWEIGDPERTVGAVECFLKSRVGMTHLQIDVNPHRHNQQGMLHTSRRYTHNLRRGHRTTQAAALLLVSRLKRHPDAMF